MDSYNPTPEQIEAIKAISRKHLQIAIAIMEENAKKAMAPSLSIEQVEALADEASNRCSFEVIPNAQNEVIKYHTDNNITIPDLERLNKTIEFNISMGVQAYSLKQVLSLSTADDEFSEEKCAGCSSYDKCKADEDAKNL